MKKSRTTVGYFHNGLPYNQVGYGPRKLVVFQGLLFENKPLPAPIAWLYDLDYQYLAEDYTTYIVLRKPGLPQGYSMKDMADDYAVMIAEEFGDAVDIIGSSTGGSIAQHFAADHAGLVRRLVIHSSAYTLSDFARKVQMRVGYLARRRRWQAAYAALVEASRYSKPVIWVA